MDDLVGQKFGKLKVIAKADGDIYGANKWMCKCQCGNITPFSTAQLVNKKRASCGCSTKNDTYLSLTKRRKDIRKVYNEMISGCEAWFENRYMNVNEEGVIVCAEWFDNFDSFYCWSLDNGMEPGMKLFRFDCTKDFEPDNCYWHTEAGIDRKKQVSERKGKCPSLFESHNL